MAVSELILLRYTPEQIQRAKEMCFAECSVGAFVDFEAGVCSVCENANQCQGWVPYVSDAAAQEEKP